MSQTAVDPADIRRLAEAIARRPEPRPPAQPAASSAAPAGALGDGIFATVDEAVRAARTAFLALSALGLDARRSMVESMRRAMRAQAESLARLAQEESGLGRVEDKVVKNLLVTERTPGTEDLAPL